MKRRDFLKTTAGLGAAAAMSRVLRNFPESIASAGQSQRGGNVPLLAKRDYGPKADSRFRKEPRIIFNDDAATILIVPPPHNKERVHVAVDYLKGTPVDILCFCLGERIKLAGSVSS